MPPRNKQQKISFSKEKETQNINMQAYQKDKNAYLQRKTFGPESDLLGCEESHKNKSD